MFFISVSVNLVEISGMSPIPLQHYGHPGDSFFFGLTPVEMSRTPGKRYRENERQKDDAQLEETI